MELNCYMCGKQVLICSCLQSLRSVKMLWEILWTLKGPIMTAADDIHKYFFIVFQRKSDLMFQVNSHEKSSFIFFKRKKLKI